MKIRSLNRHVTLIVVMLKMRAVRRRRRRRCADVVSPKRQLEEAPDLAVGVWFLVRYSHFLQQLEPIQFRLSRRFSDHRRFGKFSPEPWQGRLLRLYAVVSRFLFVYTCICRSHSVTFSCWLGFRKGRWATFATRRIWLARLNWIWMEQVKSAHFLYD